MVRDAAVVVRPNMDSPANGGTAGPMAYGDLWMGRVLSSLRWRGGARKQLYGNHAIGSEFQSSITERNPSLMVGCGHGSSDTWTGQYVAGDYSVLLTTNNAGLMEGRVVYLLSCNTAQELGPAIVNRGALAYAGYNVPFVWTVESPESPATDRLAASFGEASTMFPRVLIKGKKVREAKAQTLASFEAEIEKWERSDHPYAREVVKWLLWDRDAFTVLGGEEETGLDPRIPIAVAIILGLISVFGGAIYLRRRKRKHG